MIHGSWLNEPCAMNRYSLIVDHFENENYYYYYQGSYLKGYALCRWPLLASHFGAPWEQQDVSRWSGTGWSFIVGRVQDLILRVCSAPMLETSISVSGLFPSHLLYRFLIRSLDVWVTKTRVSRRNYSKQLFTEILSSGCRGRILWFYTALGTVFLILLP